MGLNSAQEHIALHYISQWGLMTLAQGCHKCEPTPQSFGLHLAWDCVRHYWVMHLLSYRVSTRPGNLGEIYIRWTSSIHRKIKQYSKLKYYLCVHRIGQATNCELGKKIVDPEVHCLTTFSFSHIWNAHDISLKETPTHMPKETCKSVHWCLDYNSKTKKETCQIFLIWRMDK